MKKIKNKFIIFIFIAISLIVFGTFLQPLLFSQDNGSEILLIEGKGELNNVELEINQYNELNIGDVIEIIGESSLGVVEWGDGSVTRLGGNTKLVISQSYVNADKSKIQIAFELLEGKTWSNVISFIGEDSYFKQSFSDNEAGVRGTVFNVDLEKDYIYVSDHQIELTNGSGESVIIKENKPFSLSQFSFIDLQKYIKELKDQTWEQLNINFDDEYISNLKAELLKKIQENNPVDSLKDQYNLSISELSTQEKEIIYNTLLSQYQELNIVNIDDTQLFESKQELRSLMLNFASDEQKIPLLQNTLYDFKDALKSKNNAIGESLLPILNSNAQLIEGMKIDFNELGGFIPDDLKSTIKNDFSNLMNIMNTSIGKEDINDISIDNVKQLGNKADETIKKGLDNLFNIQ